MSNYWLDQQPQYQWVSELVVKTNQIGDFDYDYLQAIYYLMKYETGIGWVKVEDQQEENEKEDH